jgi:hypothetical protein
MIDGMAFAGSAISGITLADGSRHLQVSGAFLLDSEGITVIRYFGSDSNVAVPRNVQILSPGCFYSRCSIHSLIFEYDSRLTRIEANAFSFCALLKLIQIPRSIRELCKDWALHSSLRRVIFESALSLRMMIETDKVDLSQGFGIKFVESDCPLDFPGYSVQAIPDVSDCVRLVKQ